MSLGAPWLLLCLLSIPGLVIGYAISLRRRAARAARLASEGLVQTGQPRRARLRAHVPFALFATALALLCFALARPTTSFSLPQRQGTVILAFDVSNSMLAKDLKPSRIAAAKAAASAFVERQPSFIKIGVVAFSDNAVVVQRPTNAKADVLAAIKRLSIGGGTSLGDGLFTSLSTIAGKPLKINQSALANDASAKSVNIGYFGSATIVLVSDGENTSAPDPLRLADVASSAGVRIHTVGIGTAAGTVVRIDGFEIATALDASLLKQIAKVTDGTYSQASNAAALADVYKSIHLQLKLVKKPREVTALFAAGGGLLLLAGSILSLVWFGRVI